MPCVFVSPDGTHFFDASSYSITDARAAAIATSALQI
jgi:hypothetical protein